MKSQYAKPAVNVTVFNVKEQMSASDNQGVMNPDSAGNCDNKWVKPGNCKAL